jgi:hypothetical protein
MEPLLGHSSKSVIGCFGKTTWLNDSLTAVAKIKNRLAFGGLMPRKAFGAYS